MGKLGTLILAAAVAIGLMAVGLAASAPYMAP